ncbi:hypothetical protein K402DRAFT_420499 [Aulographum hederae CBS 113979]|uniref:RRM domain-containing protein n=1 Tax=Aulographum hederae CBS 113979 TaxID=1176131 RepID=A0A6G1H2T9_9PEZI|nr:hypothetical protein K402DRAFT_420499 [Aulographum hederae CBS 113979]
MAETVTILKSYLEALLRRADFFTSVADSKGVSLPETVNVPTDEYTKLIQHEREHNNLIVALFRVGLTHEALQQLVIDQVPDAPSGTEEQTKSKDVQNKISKGTVESHAKTKRDLAFTEDYRALNAGANAFLPRRNGFRRGLESPSNASEDEFDLATDTGLEPPPSRTSNRTETRRTLLITKLPDNVTHQELVNVIRGGRIVDMYIRNDRRSANVTFAEAEAASSFIAYARRNNIVINYKMINVAWNERQMTLSQHVRKSIHNGGTRNLILRNAASKISEDVIREDLDHIHNLAVVSAAVKGSDIHLSINSVSCALFARTCMLSRGFYRGLRIDHGPDECDQPLPRPTATSNYSIPDSDLNSAIRAPANPFDLLSIDDESDDGGRDTAEGATVGFNSWYGPPAQRVRASDVVRAAMW